MKCFEVWETVCTSVYEYVSVCYVGVCVCCVCVEKVPFPWCELCFIFMKTLLRKEEFCMI